MPIIGTIASSIRTGAVASYESIQTVPVTTNGTTVVTFSNIPSTFQHLQIRGIGRSSFNYSPYDIDNCLIKFNGDGVSVGTNYGYHFLGGSGTNPLATGGAYNNSNNHFGVMSFSNAQANSFGALILDIYDYANTNKAKTYMTMSGVDFNGNQSGQNQRGAILYYSGLWNNTNAISSISLFLGTSQTWAANSHFALYGIRAAS